MAETTNIAWTDATWNPWIGCTKVSPGCDHCYAEALMDTRWQKVQWGAGKPRQRTSPANWRKPLAWNAQPFVECMDCGWRGEARAAKVLQDPPGFHPPVDSMKACPRCHTPTLKEARRRVFCASLADVFDNEVQEDWRQDLWELIVCTPNLDWLILTKRIGNASSMVRMAEAFAGEMPSNVWLGASVVNQEEADRDIPKLLATPAAKRFISYEPALGPVDFVFAVNQECRHEQGYEEPDTGAWVCRRCEEQSEMDGLDWIIIGGESAQGGHAARPFDIQWARDTVSQCRAAGVPVFVKQLGSNPAPLVVEAGSVRERLWLNDRAGADPAEWPADLRVQEFPL